MPLHNDSREFIELLVAHEVRFVLVGGHAVAFHGHPRYTGDIDFLVRATDENASRLRRVLSEFGFAHVVENDAVLEELTELVQNKRASGRPKDIADAMILESRQS